MKSRFNYLAKSLAETLDHYYEENKSLFAGLSYDEECSLRDEDVAFDSYVTLCSSYDASTIAGARAVLLLCAESICTTYSKSRGVSTAVASIRLARVVSNGIDNPTFYYYGTMYQTKYGFDIPLGWELATELAFYFLGDNLTLEAKLFPAMDAAAQ